MFLRSRVMLNDNCDTLEAFRLTTHAKSNDEVDVFIAAPCSKGK